MKWKKNRNLKAIAILRVSSHRQKDNTSHDVQEQEIKKYCDDESLELMKVFKIVESAKKSEDRLHYKEAIKWALKNSIPHILFYSIRI